MTGRTTDSMRQDMKRFLWRGMQGVAGWLNPLCARAIIAAAEAQHRLGIAGAVGEIGVFAGRLFILLKLATRPDECAFAIDLFDTAVPADGGPRAVSCEEFLGNVARWTGSVEGVTAFARASRTVTSGEVLAACGPVRLLSIDGEHSAEAVMADLQLAAQVATPEAIVFVDDVFNPDWPEVAVGVYRLLTDPGFPLQPFATTPSKLLLAPPSMHETYRSALRGSLAASHTKTTWLMGTPVEVFTRKPRWYQV